VHAPSNGSNDEERERSKIKRCETKEEPERRRTRVGESMGSASSVGCSQNPTQALKQGKASTQPTKQQQQQQQHIPSTKRQAAITAAAAAAALFKPHSLRPPPHLRLQHNDRGHALDLEVVCALQLAGKLAVLLHVHSRHAHHLAVSQPQTTKCGIFFPPFG
jgi:hypothetical protein